MSFEPISLEPMCDDSDFPNHGLPPVVAIINHQFLVPDVEMKPPLPRKRKGRPRKDLAAKIATAEVVAIKRQKNRTCAKQCRARKKIRYAYLTELLEVTEEKVLKLRKELEDLQEWAKFIDSGELPMELLKYKFTLEGF